MGALIFILVLVAVAAGIWYSIVAKRRRIQELTAVATRLGLQFSEDDPFGLTELPFALFRAGQGRGCENVMWGNAAGMPLRLFDFWYYEETTNDKGQRSRTYHRFSCALTEIGAACPHLTVERESLLTRLADHLGFHDIEFESEEFNRAYQIKGPDRKFAYALVDARMMAWLLGQRRARFEVDRALVLCATSRLKPAELPALSDTLREFRDHIPLVVSSLYPAPAAGEARA